MDEAQTRDRHTLWECSSCADIRFPYERADSFAARDTHRTRETERWNRNYADGALITPEHSAAVLLALLAGDDTGAVWDVSAAPAGA